VSSPREFLGASARKPGRPRGSLGAKAQAIRAGVLELTGEYRVMTVRQVFYALMTRGIVPKTENGGYRPVQTQVLRMRREGLLPWRFIADATRWRRKPETWDSVEDALHQVQRTYRRNLWRSQLLRLEVWLEKDALAGVLADVTERWDVSLMVSRGTSSATFLHAAGEVAREAWEQAGTRTVVLALYDYDAGGARAFRAVDRALRDGGFGAPPTSVELLAVTEHQIDSWALPTRPAKPSDPEAHKFGPEAVELDAIPPDRLVALVEDAIVARVDAEAWAKELAAESSEREVLARLVEESV
jgi:hypothetical protein